MSVMEVAPVQRFYRYHAAIYDFTRWTLLLGRSGAIGELKLKPDSRVLEVGCGTGLNFTRILKYLHPDKGRLVGVDFSKPMLKRARRRVDRHRWGHVDLINTDATRLTLDDQFDRALFAYSLSMIPDWELALERAVTHLKEGGRLVVLDFGQFEKWSMFGPVMRGFLRFNHVDMYRDVGLAMKAHCREVSVRNGLGGHHIVAVGVK